MSSITIAIIICFIYLIVLLYQWRKTKQINVAVLLFGVYFLTALFCLWTVYNSPQSYNLSLINQLYLFVIVYVFIYPFLSNRPSLQFKENLNRRYINIARFYILISAFSCVVYLPIAYDCLINAQWQDIYDQAHESSTQTSILTKFANLFFRLRYLGLVLLFYFFRFKTISKGYLYILVLAVVLPLVLVSVTQASRGGMVSLMISLYITYVLFSNELSMDIKRTLRKVMLFVIPVFALYLTVVTISRFNDSVFFDSASDSTLYYLGHSFLKFDDGIMDSISHYTLGDYFWGTEQLKSLVRSRSFLDVIYGTHFGTDFYTFVGGLYLDFGPFGTFIIAILVCKMIKSLWKKQTLTVADYFLVLTYAMFLLNGVFVVGVGYGMQWIETIFLYYLLKKIEN